MPSWSSRPGSSGSWPTPATSPRASRRSWPNARPVSPAPKDLGRVAARTGLPRGGDPDQGRASRAARRYGPGRRRRSGRLHRGHRALAGRRDPGQLRRLAGHHGAPQGHRPAAPGPGRPGEARAARRHHDRDLGRRRHRRRRAAGRGVRLLPPGAAPGVADRAHPARRRRTDHGRDRRRLPGRRTRHDPAPPPGPQDPAGDARRRARARSRPPGRTTRRGPRGRLPGLQRGLPGQRGPPARPARPRRPGRDPDPAAAPADAARAGGPRPARAGVAARVPGRDPFRRLGAAGPACRPGPDPLEQGAHRRRQPPARPGPGDARVRSIPGPGGHRRAARRSPQLYRNRLAPDPHAVRPAPGPDPVPGGAAQPGRGDPLPPGSAGRAGGDRAPRYRAGRLPAVPRAAGRPADQARPPQRGPSGQRAGARAGRQPGRTRAPRPPSVVLRSYISTTGRTSIVIQPLSTPGQVLAMSTASSMVSVSSTEYPPSASLVSRNGPSVTPLARTLLAVAGGASWCPPSTSLPEPPPPFSYQAPISAYHAWPSASVMFLAFSVSSSRITYFTVCLQVSPVSFRPGRPRGRPGISSTNGAPPIPTAPQKSFRCSVRWRSASTPP